MTTTTTCCQKLSSFTGRLLLAGLLLCQGVQMMKQVPDEDSYRYHFLRFNHYFLKGLLPCLNDWYSIIFFWLAASFVLAGGLLAIGSLCRCCTCLGPMLAFGAVLVYSLIMENPMAFGREIEEAEQRTLMIDLVKSAGLAAGALLLMGGR